MKTFVKTMLAAFAAALLVASCGKDDKASSSSSVVGEWHLEDYSVRSVTVGSETVDVWIAFASSRKFTLWQLLGEGRYRVYTGSWSLSKDVLSGKYDDGTAWASSYRIVRKGKRLTLTTVGKNEVTVYVKSSVPEEVKEYAY